MTSPDALRRASLAASLAAAGLALAGCGGSKHSSSPTTTEAANAPPPPAATSTQQQPGALQGEAGSAATGDIPDNQVFLAFRNKAGGYSIKYPEGWAQKGSGKSVTFRDKNNIVRIVITSGGPAAVGAVTTELSGLKGAQVQGAPHAMTVSGRPAVKVVYTTRSARNAVTGKRVELMVDRYYFWKGGRRAVVDLGTPAGVDNVDAYRLMAQSFRWS